MDDPDAGDFTHWVIFNIPAEKNKLDKEVPKKGTLSDDSRQGMNSFNNIGYGGPCPPPGMQHRYHFKIYALDKKLALSQKATKNQVEGAMIGHILANGLLIGRFGK